MCNITYKNLISLHSRVLGPSVLRKFVQRYEVFLIFVSTNGEKVGENIVCVDLKAFCKW